MLKLLFYKNEVIFSKRLSLELGQRLSVSLMYNEWIFYLLKNIVSFSESLCFGLIRKHQNSKTLLHIRHYIFFCLFRILNSTKMKFGRILISATYDISNLFSALLLRLETSSRPFDDFHKMAICDLLIFSRWYLLFLIALVLIFKTVKNKLTTIGF